ncbi:metallophosphoesterase [Aureimonas mangrovi]|uniref:metallophosphoesterase n=1 Tax=Aureimonas mangrovi TaxID=2758041 RepID=UPI00163D5446|nr:metallophosphoesterase [Aureimonas mangrovi]
MKLWILSDLHLENRHEPRRPEFVMPDDADIAVLAGDIWSPPSRSVAWAAQFGKPTILVAGNHEFYGRQIDSSLGEAQDMRISPHVHFLENACVVVGGVRFVGATLWTDYSLYDWPETRMKSARLGMLDHRTIIGFDGQALTPEELRNRHIESLQFIDIALSNPFDGPSVVVTHHAPSDRSVHDRFKGDPLTPAFASELDWMIEERQPSLWIHGHMHDPSDYVIGETRVICNPRGYYSRNDVENRSFDPALVVEV